MQPPSGGCVLKPTNEIKENHKSFAAAFGRLCVETTHFKLQLKPFSGQPPSGGCVLKLKNNNKDDSSVSQPPSGGCVLKLVF